MPSLRREACCVFNLSNRYLDLDPVIGRQAGDAGLVCRICYDLTVSDDEKRAGKQPSIWAVMAANEADLGSLAADRPMAAPCPAPGFRGLDRRLFGPRRLSALHNRGELIVPPRAVPR